MELILYLSILLHLHTIHTQNIQSLMQLEIFLYLFLFYHDILRTVNTKKNGLVLKENKVRRGIKEINKYAHGKEQII
jgi:hypothetical protein